MPVPNISHVHPDKHAKPVSPPSPFKWCNAGGTCPFRKSAPLSRPPRIAIRSSAFHSLHNGCVRVTGLPSELSLQDTVCYGARGARLRRPLSPAVRYQSERPSPLGRRRCPPLPLFCYTEALVTAISCAASHWQLRAGIALRPLPRSPLPMPTLPACRPRHHIGCNPAE